MAQTRRIETRTPEKGERSLFRLVVTFSDGRSEITRHLSFDKVQGLMSEAFAVAKVSGLLVSFYAEAD